MKISTRGRYALRIMIDLAVNSGGGYVPMKDAAQRQGLSLKYIERIMPSLVEAGFVEGVHGKGGGYRLTRDPSEYRVGDILRLAEGDDFSPVTCLESGAPACPRAKICKTLPLWKELKSLLNDFFDSKTLKDLL